MEEAERTPWKEAKGGAAVDKGQPVVVTGGVLENMEWWDKMVRPARRVWHGVALRLRIRNPGLLKLQHDVRACAYEDVQIMWEMLRKNEIENARIAGKIKRRPIWNCFGWARWTLRRSF